MMFILFSILGLALPVFSANPYRDADFNIAGLYTIHSTSIGLECDTLEPDHVVLSEAHRFAIEHANSAILSTIGLKMGDALGDTCNDRSITLQETVNMIKSTKGLCNASPSDFNTTTLAVVGSFDCNLAENVNYLLQAFCIPVLSATCTGTQMDDIYTFPYFARTAASDVYRAQVMYDVLITQEWYHVSEITDFSMMGESLREQFKQYLYYCTSYDLNGLVRTPCVEDSIELSFFKQDAPIKSQLENFQRLLKRTKIRVFVVFMEPAAIDMLMSSLQLWGYLPGQLQFILPTMELNLNFSNVYEYAYAVDSYVPRVKSFEEKLRNVTINTTTNKYLIEMIMIENECCEDTFADDCPFSLRCSGDEKLRTMPDVGIHRARLVIDSISLIAHSIVKMHKKYCAKGEKLCTNFLTNFNGSSFFDTMLDTKFNSIETNETFQLLERSGLPNYDIFQRQNGTWEPVLLHYNPLLGPEASEENVEPIDIAMFDDIREETFSCQTECVNSIMDIGKGCCWSCTSCPKYSYINSSMSKCTPCPSTLIPNENLTGCEKPKVSKYLFLKPSEEMNFMITGAALGILLTIPAIALLIWKRGTPMVVAATPDLAFTQSAVVIGLFVASACMVPSPQAVICGIVWAFSALLLAACHAVFLTKALRISRPDFFVRLINTAKTPAKASAAVTVVMLFIQMFIVMIWIFLRPPEVTWDREQAHPSCTSNNEGQTVILLIIPLILLCITLIFQKKACANQYIYQVHQARVGLAGSLCFIVNYAVLIPLIFIEESTEQVKAVILMCIPLLTGYVAWLTMLLPTSYELLAKPKQNAQEYVTRQRSRQFQEGNVMYYVESIVFNRPKGNTINTIDTERSGNESCK